MAAEQIEAAVLAVLVDHGVDVSDAGVRASVRERALQMRAELGRLGREKADLEADAERALKELEAEGVIERTPTCGWEINLSDPGSPE